MAYPPTANQPSTVTFFFSRSLCYPLSVIHRRKNKDCFLKRAAAFLPPLKTALEKSESPRLDRIENRQMEKRIDKWKKKNNNEKHIKKVKKNWNNSIKRNSKKKKKSIALFPKKGRKSSLMLSHLWIVHRTRTTFSSLLRENKKRRACSNSQQYLDSTSRGTIHDSNPIDTVHNHQSTFHSRNVTHSPNLRERTVPKSRADQLRAQPNPATNPHTLEWKDKQVP